mmetsp:Transcript_21085/g.32675  ORF Transcript_21085/g.32675 Transcript_21085/m.32675 type:complete len:81 (+) Transcript_21085:1054-1296(+)
MTFNDAMSEMQSCRSDTFTDSAHDVHIEKVRDSDFATNVIESHLLKPEMSYLMELAHDRRKSSSSGLKCSTLLMLRLVEN